MSQRSSKCNVILIELKRELSPVQKNHLVESLNELAEIDSIFQSELDFINSIKSKFEL